MLQSIINPSGQLLDRCRLVPQGLVVTPKLKLGHCYYCSKLLVEVVVFGVFLVKELGKLGNQIVR